MTAILQITVEGSDWVRLRGAVEWLRDTVPHPEGFVSLRVLRDSSQADRVVLLEEWTSEEQFFTALREYGPTGTTEFLSRTGLDASAFVNTLWLSTDVLAVERPTQVPA